MKPKAAPPQPAIGGLRIERRGLRSSVFATLGKDVYHFLHRASWSHLLAVAVVVYLVSNLVFAALLWVGGAELTNARAGSFVDCFFFSVQSLATIGYGYLAPVDTWANVIVTVEGFYGLLLTAAMTGVFFAKFSTPTARVAFSKLAVIAPADGVPTLTFRMANARTTAIVEATVKVTLSRDEVTAEGEQVRRLHDLVLRRSSSPMFALSWTVYHPVDVASPLWGLTAESAARDHIAILVTFSGIDDRLATTVHARHAFSWSDLRWDMRLVDIVRVEGDKRIIDYTRFDDVEPIAGR